MLTLIFGRKLSSTIITKNQATFQNNSDAIRQDLAISPLSIVWNYYNGVNRSINSLHDSIEDKLHHRPFDASTQSRKKFRSKKPRSKGLLNGSHKIRHVHGIIPPFPSEPAWKQDLKEQESIDRYALHFQKLLLNKLKNQENKESSQNITTSPLPTDSFDLLSTPIIATHRSSCLKKKSSLPLIFQLPSGRIAIRKNILLLMRRFASTIADVSTIKRIDQLPIKPIRPDFQSESIFSSLSPYTSHLSDENTSSLHLRSNGHSNDLEPYLAEQKLQQELNQLVSSKTITRDYYARRSNPQLIRILFFIAIVYELVLLSLEYLYTSPNSNQDLMSESGFENSTNTTRLGDDFSLWLESILYQEPSLYFLDALLLLLSSLFQSPTSSTHILIDEWWKFTQSISNFWDTLPVCIFLWRTRNFEHHFEAANLLKTWLIHLENRYVSPVESEIYCIRPCERTENLFMPKLTDNVFQRLLSLASLEQQAKMAVKLNAISILLHVIQVEGNDSIYAPYGIDQNNEANVYSKWMQALISEKPIEAFLQRDSLTLNRELENVTLFADKLPHTVSQILIANLKCPNVHNYLNSYRMQLVNATIAFLLNEGLLDKEEEKGLLLAERRIRTGLILHQDEEIDKEIGIELSMGRNGSIPKLFPALAAFPYLVCRYYNFGMWNNFGLLLPRQRAIHVANRSISGVVAILFALSLQENVAKLTGQTIKWAASNPFLHPLIDGEITFANVCSVAMTTSWAIQLGLLYYCPFTLFPVLAIQYYNCNKR